MQQKTLANIHCVSILVKVIVLVLLPGWSVLLLFLVLIIILCILCQDAALMLAQCGLTPCWDRRWLPACLHGHMHRSQPHIYIKA